VAKRKGLSKKTRFEVFKRDSFKCQYCGRSAPDVILVIDHIRPVSKAGENDLLNLITACDGCNSGKGDRLLDDQSTLVKQRQQLEELNERREQLEMLLAWKESLASFKEDVVERLCDYWRSRTPGWSLNESGRQTIRRLLAKFSADEVVEAMNIAAEAYLVLVDGTATEGSVDTAWKKVGGICHVRSKAQEKPYLKDLYYIRGILRRRVYVNESVVMKLLEDAVVAGVDPEALKSLAKQCRNWSEFRDEVQELSE